ncbi:MAG TPA: hypothetical protein VN969_38985 [Streptosporangiaceae bacterium]|nr:hypothetical protein [Streptosporangiaceae bacterium]
MNTPASGLFDGQRGLAEPYPGGRAQAESGSKILENDYYAWKAVCLQPYRLRADHPVLREFTYAWQAVSTLGLGDDAGAASIRYRVLGHTARSLVPAGGGREAQALLCLWRHASVHGDRLYATGLDQFLRSGASGRYADFAHAAAGSENIEKRYQALTTGDPGIARDSATLVQAWTCVEEDGLMNGPASAAERYRALSGHARGVANDMERRLPTATLTLLLELAMHADKHAIRLHHTAVAIKNGTVDQSTPYRGLPVEVAARATQGHTDIPRDGRAAVVATGAATRPVRKQNKQRGA